MTPAFWAHSALKTQCPFCLSGEPKALGCVRRKGTEMWCYLKVPSPPGASLALLHSPSGKIRMGSLLLSWTCSVSLNRRVSKISRRDRRSQQQSTQQQPLTCSHYQGANNRGTISQYLQGHAVSSSREVEQPSASPNLQTHPCSQRLSHLLATR